MRSARTGLGISLAFAVTTASASISGIEEGSLFLLEAGRAGTNLVLTLGFSDAKAAIYLEKDGLAVRSEQAAGSGQIELGELGPGRYFFSAAGAATTQNAKAPPSGPHRPDSHALPPRDDHRPWRGLAALAHACEANLCAQAA